MSPSCKKKRYLFDLEADNLLPAVTVIHCGVIYDLDTDELHRFDNTQIPQLFVKLLEADELWGHNIVSYDIPLLMMMAVKYLSDTDGGFGAGGADWIEAFEEKFKGKEGELVMDTLILSRLIWSDIMNNDMEGLKRGKLILPPGASTKEVLGRHSLRAWGYRLNFLKGHVNDNDDFSTYTPEMLEYCALDAKVNIKLIDAIMKKAPNEYSVWIEHQFAVYLRRQMDNGVAFDVEKAEFFVGCWERELAKRVDEMNALVPSITHRTMLTPKVNNKARGYVKGVPIEKIKVVPFNPRSNDHVASFLINKYNWQPLEFTKTQKPKVTYDILKSLKYVEAPLLARIKLLMDRIGLVKEESTAWLKCVKDGRIHGFILHNGTPTARCRHSGPNLGNIPSPKAIWGLVMRSLFIAATGYKLSGTDFDGLEMRCLAAVLFPRDGGAFFEMAFAGKKEEGTDAHTLNQKSIVKLLRKAGFIKVAEAYTRDKAKTEFYAWLYGAWPRKLGMIACDGLDIPATKFNAVGKCIQQGFLDNIKGISEVIEDLEQIYNDCTYNRQWPIIKGLDGRRIPIRKKSALLNSLLQSMGAILCKVACVKLMHELDERLEQDQWKPVLHVHDEIQLEVLNEREVLTIVSEVVDRCFRESGEQFGLPVPIVGTTSIGDNWAQTH